MRKHDFYALPRSLQDRFIESSQGVSVPKPLLVSEEADNRSIKWAGASLLTFAVWAGYTLVGFGDLASPMALGGTAHLGIHLGLSALFAGLLLRSFAISWEGSRSPYGSGAFLFSSGVVLASGSRLFEYDARDVTSAKVEGQTLVLAFPERTFRFKAGDAERTEVVLSAFQAGAASWAKLSGEESLERARLSPLVESGVPNPLAPTDPHRRPQLFSLPLLLAMALLMGGTLGYAVSYWRTSLSERAIYDQAVSLNTVDAYNAYLARGGERPLVRELLLPRAELAGAVAAGSVSALTEFQKRHPDSKILGEVEVALRAAMLRELDGAKKAGTLAALDALKAKYPSHTLIVGEIAQARRDVFVRALHDFQRAANPETAELVPLVQKLLGYAEQKGGKVQVRFLQSFPQDPTQLENIVRKSEKYYLGRKWLPMQYFLGDEARRRETELGTKILERLQKAFPKDVLTFELAPLPKDINEELPEISGPTLTIEHREKLSGGFVGGKPKGMFLGVALFLSAKFELPGDEEGYAYDYNTWRSPQFAILADRDKGVPDIYNDMMDGAFDTFAEKYLATWFIEP